MDEPVNIGRNHAGRFAKGRTGNPAGKPKGARHRVTLLAERMLDAEAGDVVRAVIAAAIAGDMGAARLILERILPPRKGRPVVFDLPPLDTPAGVLNALGCVIRAVSNGELTTDEGASVASLLELNRRALEMVDFEARLCALEQGGKE